MRMTHEASLYQENCFITLTYKQEKLPSDHSLNLNHFQDFMKRLRKKYVPTNPYRRFKNANKKSRDYLAYKTFQNKHAIRFYHCGEYGDALGRPHYHAIIFNHDFKDKILWKEKEGIVTYVSKELDDLWTHGYCSVGLVTFESAAYCARYVTKKVTGERSHDHYTIIDEYGQEHILDPEYSTMSRASGLGKGWLEKWQDEVYPLDEVIMRGKLMKPTRYYDQLYDANTKNLEQIKKQRMTDAEKYKENNTQKKLNVRETVKKAQFTQLKRNLEKK